MVTLAVPYEAGNGATISSANTETTVFQYTGRRFRIRTISITNRATSPAIVSIYDGSGDSKKFIMSIAVANGSSVVITGIEGAVSTQGVITAVSDQAPVDVFVGGLVE